MTDTHALGSIEPVAWQPKYKQDVIDHHRSLGGEVWDYAMTVYSSKQGAENYGIGGHEVRALYALPADYLERVRAMEAEIARLKSDRLYTIGFNDGYDAALSNRENGDV